MEKAKTYTPEQLQGMTRVEIRQTAMAVLGLNARQASELKTDDARKMILEKQGGKKKDSTDDKSAKGSFKARRSTPPAEEPEEKQEGSEETVPDTDAGKRLDTLGKCIDEVESLLKEKTTDIERQLYMLAGLISDCWMAQCGAREELDERLDELEKELGKSEGNG